MTAQNHNKLTNLKTHSTQNTQKELYFRNLDCFNKQVINANPVILCKIQTYIIHYQHPLGTKKYSKKTLPSQEMYDIKTDYKIKKL